MGSTPEGPEKVFQKKRYLSLELVFYCCITNYHKFSSLKQQSFISSQFCRAEVHARCWPGSLLRVSHKAEVKVSMGCVLIKRPD